MIKPSIGSIMWYWPEKHLRSDQPWPAIVSYVHSDNLVNVSVWNKDGHAQNGRTSVPVVQDGSPYTVGNSPYVEWMPYQKGQAAKAEKAEGDLAEVRKMASAGAPLI